MGSESQPLRVFFFPFMAQGHMIPMVDMATLFASYGVHSTIITTPVYSTNITKTISKSNSLGHKICIKTIPFRAVEVGLPEGCECADKLSSEGLFKFSRAVNLLQEPLEKLLESERPDCLVSDLFFPWSADSAYKLNIPRIIFQGTNFFAMCAMESLRLYEPYKRVIFDAELFGIPNLPNEIRITRTQFPMEIWEDEGNEYGKLLAEARQAELKSYGMLVNSFVELEPGYVEHYRNVTNTKAWCVGPVSVCNRNVEENGVRGGESDIEDDQCLKWLDGKELDSVVYVCFGSVVGLPDDQLHDIALGLELSGQNFIWVVRRSPDSRSEDYLPKGFEDRVRDRGLLIRGWAPQVLILDHPSVGGFLTHCGWNSVLEGITAGVPLLTWPLSTEQFLNEKLITDVLGIGVGVHKPSWNGEDRMEKEAIEMAVRVLMEGEEQRGRVSQLGKLAKQATEKDGSSYTDLLNLLDELKAMRET